MEIKEIIGYILTLFFSYLFLLYALFYIKVAPVTEIFSGALVLLALGVLATITCPTFWKCYGITFSQRRKRRR